MAMVIAMLEKYSLAGRMTGARCRMAGGGAHSAPPGVFRGRMMIVRIPAFVRLPSSVRMALLVLLGAGTIAQAQDSSAVQPWQIIRPPQSSLVFARDGSLIGQIGREWRTNVSLAALPPYVYQAFVAVEDRRF